MEPSQLISFDGLLRGNPGGVTKEPVHPINQITMGSSGPSATLSGRCSRRSGWRGRWFYQVSAPSFLVSQPKGRAEQIEWTISAFLCGSPACFGNWDLTLLKDVALLLLFCLTGSRQLFKGLVYAGYCEKLADTIGRPFPSLSSSPSLCVCLGGCMYACMYRCVHVPMQVCAHASRGQRISLNVFLQSLSSVVALRW